MAREATKDTGQGDSTPGVVPPTPLDLQNPPGAASKHSWTSKTFLEISPNGPGHPKSSSGFLQTPLNLQNPPEGLSKLSWTSKILLGVLPNSLITLRREQLALWERSLCLHIKTGVQEQQQKGEEKIHPWERGRKKIPHGKEVEKRPRGKEGGKYRVWKRGRKNSLWKRGRKISPVEKRDK